MENSFRSTHDFHSRTSITTISPEEKEELNKRIREAFRERQRKRKEQFVKQLVLGRGLGNAAEESVRDALYNPKKVLEPLTEEEKLLWNPIDLTSLPTRSAIDERDPGEQASTSVHPLPHRSLQAEAEEEEEEEGASAVKDKVGDAKRASVASSLDALLPPTQGPPLNAEEPPRPPSSSSNDLELPFIEKFRCSYRHTGSIFDARMDVEENISTAERELNALCHPFNFHEVLESLTIILSTLEVGDLDVKVSMPMLVRKLPSANPEEHAADMAREQEDPLFLTGANEVLDFARENVLSQAYDIITDTHTAQWVLLYTVTFLRSISAQTTEEAELRVQLQARCVRIMGDTENFSSILLSLESRIEEYDAFVALKESAEVHLGILLEDVEQSLKVLLNEPFPVRRAKLRLLESGIRAKLQRALFFLNEIDYNWTPTVRFHTIWKRRFLSSAFYRIHVIISPRFTSCSLGFIDESLYKMMNETRVISNSKLATSLPFQAKIPFARNVEYDRVLNYNSFQQIGMSVKGSASLVVGHQLCMGARYILRQSTPDFDRAWRFEMNEPTEDPKDHEEVTKMITKMTNKARQKAHSNAPPKLTFLTQGDADDGSTSSDSGSI